MGFNLRYTGQIFIWRYRVISWANTRYTRQTRDIHGKIGINLRYTWQFRDIHGNLEIYMAEI